MGPIFLKKIPFFYKKYAKKIFSLTFKKIMANSAWVVNWNYHLKDQRKSSVPSPIPKIKWIFFLFMFEPKPMFIGGTYVYGYNGCTLGCYKKIKSSLFCLLIVKFLCQIKYKKLPYFCFFEIFTFKHAPRGFFVRTRPKSQNTCNLKLKIWTSGHKRLKLVSKVLSWKVKIGM